MTIANGAPMDRCGGVPLDDLDRAIVLATQDGLPIDVRPFHRVAERVGATPADVIERMRRMLARGVIRRIAAVPDHYALGYRANGMTVWDVEDDRLAELGPRVGGLPFVSHCYHRPRQLPRWPYNLFAMVHGKTRDQVEQRADEIAALLGSAGRKREILYSTRILKKTGLRLSGD